jgi:trimeric autotransporter adhesin
MHQVDGVVVQGNRFERNNVERAAQGTASGGFKITEGNNLLLADNLAQNNEGDGLWIDVATNHTQVLRNVVRNNRADGIQVEISGHSLVASNYVYDNGGRGIYILESNDVDVFNNTTARNDRNIYVLEGARNSGTADVPQQVDDVRIVNNVLSGAGSGADLLLATDDATHRRSAEDMRVTANNNAFYRTSATSPRWLVAWGDWPTDQRVFNNLAEFAQATGNERNGIAVDGGSEPFFVNAAAGNFTLKPGSALIGEGVALPASIASVLGVSAGVPVNIGALG